jgi:hypothetical protein
LFCAFEDSHAFVGLDHLVISDDLRQRRWWLPVEYSGPGNGEAPEVAFGGGSSPRAHLDLIKVEYESFDPFEATETGSGYQAKSGQPPKHDPRNSGR